MWIEIKPEVIQICFKKAAFHVADSCNDYTTEEEETFEELKAVSEYATLDDNLLTPCLRDLEEIIYDVHAQLSRSEANTRGSDSSDEEDKPSPTINVSKRFQNISELKLVFSSFENTEKMLTVLHRAENFLSINVINQSKQTKIDIFSAVININTFFLQNTG